MMTMTIDKGAAGNINKQFDYLKSAGVNNAMKALYIVAEKIKNEAQMRLRGRLHIVTSRLRNSLFIKTPQMQALSYSDKNGKQFMSELISVSLAPDELAIGTNVEYSEKIEALDSYLGWAVQSADVSRSIGEDMKQNMENIMKFGPGIIPAQ